MPERFWKSKLTPLNVTPCAKNSNPASAGFAGIAIGSDALPTPAFVRTTEPGLTCNKPPKPGTGVGGMVLNANATTHSAVDFTSNVGVPPFTVTPNDSTENSEFDRASIGDVPLMISL